MQTQCKASQLQFQGLGRRQIVASFDGGRLSSDGGLLLLREVATATGLLDRFARCFTDYRDSRLIEHTVAELVAQRVLGLAQGYEDLNDHQALRDDPLLALAVGKDDLSDEFDFRVRIRHLTCAAPILSDMPLVETALPSPVGSIPKNQLFCFSLLRLQADRQSPLFAAVLRSSKARRTDCDESIRLRLSTNERQDRAPRQPGELGETSVVERDGLAAIKNGGKELAINFKFRARIRGFAARPFNDGD